jgi:hypothetical protein
MLLVVVRRRTGPLVVGAASVNAGLPASSEAMWPAVPRLRR